MLQRLCATMRRQEIALAYYFEATGSWRPGGIMVAVFFERCVLLVVCCVVHKVTVG